MEQELKVKLNSEADGFVNTINAATAAESLADISKQLQQAAKTLVWRWVT